MGMDRLQGAAGTGFKRGARLRAHDEEDWACAIFMVANETGPQAVRQKAGPKGKQQVQK